MWQNERLKEFNDQISQFKRNNKETKKKTTNVYGLKTDYFKVIFIKIIAVSILMPISYWLYDSGLLFYEDIINNEIKSFTVVEYYSSIMLSFTMSFGSTAALFFDEIISFKKDTTYKNIIQAFKNIIILSLGSGMIGFLFSLGFSFFYILSVRFLDLTWSFYHNIIIFLVFLPWFFYLTKKELKKHFKNQKEKENYISEIEEKNKALNLDYTNKIEGLTEDFINSINTIDKYNFLKITCSDMNLFQLKSFYNEIEKNLLKETEFDDFTLYEKSIIRKRSGLNMIENI